MNALSLAAARADNFYYPKNYDPKKHGSLNKFHKSHPLRDRIKPNGVLVIRFEMPFKVICEGCHGFVAKGVRFNADKKHVGNYFSTKIWEFKMKCPSCPQQFTIKTDPQNTAYSCESGLRKKTEDWDPADAEQLTVVSEEVQERMRIDPIFRMERTADRRDTLEKEQDALIEAYQKAEDGKGAPAAGDLHKLNSLARARMREVRHHAKIHEGREWIKGDEVLTEADRVELDGVEFTAKKRGFDEMDGGLFLRDPLIHSLIGPELSQVCQRQEEGVRQASQIVEECDRSKRLRVIVLGGSHEFPIDEAATCATSNVVTRGLVPPGHFPPPRFSSGHSHTRCHHHEGNTYGSHMQHSRSIAPLSTSLASQTISSSPLSLTSQGQWGASRFAVQASKLARHHAVLRNNHQELEAASKVKRGGSLRFLGPTGDDAPLGRRN